MTRIENLIVSLLSLVSLGAAQDNEVFYTDCEDGTRCPWYDFCFNTTVSAGTICAQQAAFDVLCSRCDSNTQVCVEEGPGEDSCQPRVTCATGCADCDHFCYLDDDSDSRTGVCLPLSANTTTGAVKCEDGSYCAEGSFCVAQSGNDDVAHVMCAPQPANDELCKGCSAYNQSCYTGPQVGQVACVTLVNCANNCTGDTNFCDKKSDDDAEGACFKYSSKNTS